MSWDYLVAVRKADWPTARIFQQALGKLNLPIQLANIPDDAWDSPLTEYGQFSECYFSVDGKIADIDIGMVPLRSGNDPNDLDDEDDLWIAPNLNKYLSSIGRAETFEADDILVWIGFRMGPQDHYGVRLAYWAIGTFLHSFKGIYVDPQEGLAYSGSDAADELISQANDSGQWRGSWNEWDDSGSGSEVSAENEIEQQQSSTQESSRNHGSILSKLARFFRPK